MCVLVCMQCACVHVCVCACVHVCMQCVCVCACDVHAEDTDVQLFRVKEKPYKELKDSDGRPDEEVAKEVRVMMAGLLTLLKVNISHGISIGLGLPSVSEPVHHCGPVPRAGEN